MQGRCREASSEGSMEQTRDLTYRNRIGGTKGGPGESAPDDEAPIHRGTAGFKSGRCAGKAVRLTSGDLHRVRNSGLRKPRGILTAVQESAEGVIFPGVGAARETLFVRKERNSQSEPNP